jgi:TolA-binding protein
MASLNSRILVSAISLILVGLIPSGTAMAGFQQDYDKALKTFQNSKSPGDYQAAAKQFSALVERQDGGALHANCLYWLAECWYGLKDYVQALNGFEKALLFPKSNKEEASRYKVAVCYVRLGWKDSAKWELSRFLRDYPKSSLAGSVKRELDKLPKEDRR